MSLEMELEATTTEQKVLFTNEAEMKPSRFHPAQLACLDPHRVPSHIALIPDGNRRWAKKQLLSPHMGHQAGADRLIEVVRGAQELNVKALTFFAFSTENWSRPKFEISALMSIYSSFLTIKREEMVADGIKLETIGDLTPFPSSLKQVIAETKAATAHCDKIRLVLAFNYGARNELCRAFKSMLEDYDNNRLSKDEVTEKTIARYLDTAHLGDPDLLIRTSGELRVSNYLLWQISYAEIVVTPVLWPDFTPHHLLDSILEYQKRQRRLGGD